MTVTRPELGALKFLTMHPPQTRLIYNTVILYSQMGTHTHHFSTPITSVKFRVNFMKIWFETVAVVQAAKVLAECPLGSIQRTRDSF